MALQKLLIINLFNKTSKMEKNFVKDLIELNPESERKMRANFVLEGYSERAFLKLKQGVAAYNTKNMMVLNRIAKKLKLTMPEYEPVTN